MIAGVVLAAGRSSRLGTPKQLLPVRGIPMLQHTVEAVSSAGLDEVVVVLGHAADRVGSRVRFPHGARVVNCEGWAEGQSASLRAGLGVLDPRVAAAVILLGDEPDVPAAAIREVVDSHLRTGRPIVQASYRGVPGHPVLLHRDVWPAVERLRGDSGARHLLRRNHDRLVRVELDRRLPDDVDTWEDYRRLTGSLSAL